MDIFYHIFQVCAKIYGMMQRVISGAVFCDLDETIYPGSTIKHVGRYLLRRGKLPRSVYRRLIWWLFLRKCGLLNDEKAFVKGIQLIAGWSFIDLETEIRQAYIEVLRPNVPKDVWKLAKKWRQRGPLVLATESLRSIAAPFAEDLGCAAVLATEIEVHKGIVTGKLAGPVLHNEAKNHAVRSWAKTHSVALADSLAVGGRVEDVPLLQLAGEQLVLYPDRAMAQLANRSSWQIYP